MTGLGWQTWPWEPSQATWSCSRLSPPRLEEAKRGDWSWKPSPYHKCPVTSPPSYERRRPDLTFCALRIEIAALYTFQVLLTADLSRGSAVPYFLWDEPLTLDELRRRLAGDDEEERTRLSSKVMREARFDEAVGLIPVAEMVANYPRLRRNLGRRLAFWDFLMAEWRSLGLVP